MIDRGLRPSAAVAVISAVGTVIIACLAATGCGRQEPAPSAPIQLVAGPSAIASGSAAATAATASAGDGASAIAFPPRNEPFAFREDLEAKYRDGLRRSATASYVDVEGAIVWTQEYLRYRVNRCGHAAATLKVLDQIDGKGIAPVCTEGLAGIWDGTAPTYWNSPFTMDISLRGTSIAGRYTDTYDAGTLWGTYESGPVVVINAYFGDGGIRFEGEFDGPDRIKGTMRVSTISRLFSFTMTRRP